MGHRVIACHSPVPFDGMVTESGSSTVNPVDVPAAGIQSLSVRERAQDAGVARNADREQVLTVHSTSAAPVVFDPEAPIGIRPPGVVTRQPRNPLTFWSTERLPRFNDRPDGGEHGVFSPALHDPGGTMNLGSQVWRNTHRLAPQPWDSAFYLDARPGADNG